MPLLNLDRCSIHYEEYGAGEPVLLVPGSGARGRTWMYQVAALTGAGYRTVTIDNRGAGLSAPVPGPLSLSELVEDLRDFTEAYFTTPFRLVGVSLGALVAQEFLTMTNSVRQAVLIASRARPDAYGRALTVADHALTESGTTLPPVYEAAVRAAQTLSPRTLADDDAVRMWLDLFEMSQNDGSGPYAHAQLSAQLTEDRRAAYAAIVTPCLVLSFADDIITPPSRGAELAEAIKGAGHVVIPDAGHAGHIEQPEAVNGEMLRFFNAFR
ncbi:alpha/beta fold hydrolase [Streptomyces fuscichromogenes]|nr:alpha/beta hydrolase [Streptomyces fuscichromogenes]